MAEGFFLIIFLDETPRMRIRLTGDVNISAIEAESRATLLQFRVMEDGRPSGHNS
jgi:hypothetical protein